MCEPCQTPICVSCKIAGPHDGHKASDLQKGCVDLLSRVQGIVPSAVLAVDSLRALKESHAAADIALSTAERAHDTALTGIFDQARTHLDQRLRAYRAHHTQVVSAQRLLLHAHVIKLSHSTTNVSTTRDVSALNFSAAFCEGPLAHVHVRLCKCV